jgi:hypothetical protein
MATDYSNGFESTAALGTYVTLNTLAEGGSPFVLGPPDNTVKYVADAAHGTRALEIIANDVEANLVQAVDNATDELISWYVKISALPAVDLTLHRTSVGSDVTGVNIRITAAGRLGVFLSGGTQVWLAPTTFPVGEYIRIDAYIDLGAGANTGRVSIAYYAKDSTTAIASSGLLTGVNTSIAGTPIVRNRVGKTNTAVGYTGSIKIDDYRVRTSPGTTTLLGPVPGQSVPLDTPVVTRGAKTDPTTASSTDGRQTLSWPAVAGAASYEIWLASGATPAPGDFVRRAQGVTSPYEVTGLAAGTYAYGVKAKA